MSDTGATYAEPNAVADTMTLLAIIGDPAMAKANLDAWAAVQARVTAEAAALDERENAVTAREAQTLAGARNLETGRATHERAVSEHRGNLAELENARAALVAEQQQHDQNVASLDTERKELDGRAAQLAEREAALDKRAEELLASTDAADKALLARADAVEKGEADLKTKVAEWQRVTKALST